MNKETCNPNLIRKLINEYHRNIILNENQLYR